jgi:hypothetical protein
MIWVDSIKFLKHRCAFHGSKHANAEIKPSYKDRERYTNSAERGEQMSKKKFADGISAAALVIEAHLMPLIQLVSLPLK